MTTHFSTGEGQVACGRNDHNVTATTRLEAVSCKSCQASEVFSQASSAEQVLESMRRNRLKNFAVRAEPSRDPTFADEKTVFVTYNGRQEFPLSLTPLEAKALTDLLRAEFNL